MPDLIYREASLQGRAGSVDENGDYIVDVAFASELPYERWWGVEVLNCDAQSVRLDRLNSGAAVLFNHNWDDLRGVHVENSVTCRADKVLAGQVRLTSATEKGRETIALVKTGVLGKTSVGYQIHAVIEQSKTKAGKTVERTLTGKAFESLLKRHAKQAGSGDVVAFRRELDQQFGAFEREEDEPTIYRVTDWEPYENSLVTVPADNSVGVGRSAETFTEPPQQESKKMPLDENTTAAEIAAAEQRAAETARKDEAKRTNEILSVGEDHADIGGMELARAAIKDGTSVAEFNQRLLAAKREKTAQGVTFGHGARAKDNLADDAKLGFRNYGDFCADVVRAATGKETSERLIRAATVFGNESAGPDGGFGVPPEFAREIASLAYGETSLLSLADNTPISGNTMTFPQDETTPWGSTGIYAGWEGEGDQSSPRKPVLGEAQFKLRKLKVLVAASEELLADSAAMSSHITRKSGEAVDWKINDAIVNGNGAGMPLGILASGSLVTQTKEGSQAADTIVAGNVAKMYGRVIQGSGANLVWLINPDAFNQVITLSLNNNPIWVPPSQGFQGAPNGTLLGRPIILTDACDTLGDKGDIILANMAGYRAITKGSGVEFATSMHLWFDQDLMAFRLIFRMDGGPSLASAVTPPNSSVTRSHFVVLENRT